MARHEIAGEIAQSVRLEMHRGESLWASRGSLLSYTQGIAWHLRVPGGAGAAIGRVMAGEGAALTRIEASVSGAEVTLTANQPGKILAWSLEASGPVVCTRGSFLAAEGDVTIRPTMARRGGAALFGGSGLILQQVAGTGTVFIHLSGDYRDHDLAPGQELQVSTGNLAAFAQSVDYDIRGVAGCRNMMFGGEGLFMAVLRGPGRVLTQTLKRVIGPRGMQQ